MDALEAIWSHSNYWTRLRITQRWHDAFNKIASFRRRYFLILMTQKKGSKRADLSLMMSLAAKGSAQTRVDTEEDLNKFQYHQQVTFSWSPC